MAKGKIGFLFLGLGSFAADMKGNMMQGTHLVWEGVSSMGICEVVDDEMSLGGDVKGD